jgi:hypothetical protein
MEHLEEDRVGVITAEGDRERCGRTGQTALERGAQLAECRAQTRVEAWAAVDGNLLGSPPARRSERSLEGIRLFNTAVEKRDEQTIHG